MTARPRVFVTRALPGRAVEMLAEAAEVDVWPDELPPPPEELARRAADAQGLLSLLTDGVDRALLEAAEGLVVVSNMATGFDNVDVVAASERDVLVTRTPGVLSETTADFAMALMLAAARRVTEGDRYVREGRWKTWGPSILLGHDVHGATLGIVGMGRIGTEVARRARGFGMRLLYTSRTRKPALERRFRMAYVGLDELLAGSDFVTLHAALTPETAGMIGGRELALMKATAYLINTGRGPLVDQAALYEALKESRIAGAALDVTDPEPVAPDDPLLSLGNLLITPHIASASVATRSRMAELAAENLLAALAGRVPKDAVNPEIADEWRRARKRRLGPSS